MLKIFNMGESSPLYNRQPKAEKMNSQRDPPPYPGHLLKEPGYCRSYSSSEASIDISTSSSENLSSSTRQEPQGEETTNAIKSFTDGNPPPGGGNYYPNCSNGIAEINPGVVYYPVGTSQLCQNDGMCRNDVTEKSLPPGYSGNSLIGQLLQSSSEYSDLRNLLQRRLVQVSVASNQQVQQQGTGKQCIRNVELERSSRSPAMSPTIVEWSTAKLSNLVSMPAGQPAVFVGHGICHGSPTSNNSVSGCQNNKHKSSGNGCVLDGMNVGFSRQNASHSRIPIRDRQRPSTAPSDHQAMATVQQMASENNISNEQLKKLAMSHSDLKYLEQLSRNSSADFAAPPATNAVVTESRLAEEMSRSSTSHEIDVASLGQQSSHSQSHATAADKRQMMSTQRKSIQKKQLPELDHAAIATRATQMVEQLSEENQALRLELKSYYKKVSTLEKVELEIQKVSSAYESLVKHSEKRENLEKIMRIKLEAEIKKLNETNKELKDQLEGSLYQLQKRQCFNSLDSELKKELHKKDNVIAKLLKQNRDVIVAKESLQMEVSAQRLALDEQRRRINLLETTMENTQATANRYMAELEKCRLKEQSLFELQRALSLLQLNAERQDTIEQRLQMKLDDEFQMMKNQQCDTDDGISSDSESPTCIYSLIRQMQEKEHRIVQLEAEVVKWEQKYLEEAVFRHLAVDSASFSKVKMLQAELAEKEMFIRVLQHHTTSSSLSLSRASSISSLLLPSAVHSPTDRFNAKPPYMTSSSMPASNMTSRQGSQVDGSSYRGGGQDPSPLQAHKKSSSANSATDGSSSSLSFAANLSDNLHVTASQAAGYAASDQNSSPDDLKQCLWQV